MNVMTATYYIETNLICIIILLLLKHQTKARSEQESRDKQLFSYLLLAAVLFCVADIVAGICRGQVFEGARAIIEISNLLYDEMLAIVAWCWMLYVFRKIGRIFSGKVYFIVSLPLILFTVLAISNPFTSFIFSLDQSNIYHRSYGVYVHWIVSWFYLLVPMIAVIYTMAHEADKARRHELTPFLYFIIAPAVASGLQMYFYGLTTTQVGITVSVVMVFLAVQDGQIGQIHVDALTGLNNRRGFASYIDYKILCNTEIELTILMIDLDHFKQVNDLHGHVAGDRALVYAAEALKKSCECVNGRPYLCRYGGDEFVIAGVDMHPHDTEKLRSAVYREIEEVMDGRDEPFTLSVSIGVAFDKTSDNAGVETIIKLADEEMYRDKKRHGYINDR